MTTATFTASDRLFSDMHKDAYGFRPTSDCWARWNAMTDAELDIEQDRLQEAVEASIDEDRRMQADAAVRFQAHLKTLIDAGAADIDTALRWDRQALGISEEQYSFYGDSYHEWHHGLAFNYITNLRSN